MSPNGDSLFQISTNELTKLTQQLEELQKKNKELEEFNYDAEDKLEQEYKRYQQVMAENKYLKETLKQGDIGLVERENAITERDKYIDQLEQNLK